MIDIIKDLIEDSKNEIHTSLPAIIQSVNYSAGTCTVEIIPKRELCGQLIKYPTLIDVRLDYLKFGAWTIQIPRKAGDKVWIGFSESTLSEETSLERFSLNEPYIIGSCETEYEDNSEDIILTGVGTRIEIKGDGTVVLTTGANKMTINSDVEVNGNIKINGDTQQNGAITATGDVQGAGKSLKDHTHRYNPGGDPQTSTSAAN